MVKIPFEPDAGTKEGAAWFASGDRSRVPRTVETSMLSNSGWLKLKFSSAL